jgi:hypothetical protein
MALTNQRVAWFNGKIVRESEVMIPFRDRGFLCANAVFNMTRSFNGKAFRFEEHIARPYRSLKYLDIVPEQHCSKLHSTSPFERLDKKMPSCRRSCQRRSRNSLSLTASRNVWMMPRPVPTGRVDFDAIASAGAFRDNDLNAATARTESGTRRSLSFFVRGKSI